MICQFRTFSKKRLLYKIAKINEQEFKEILMEQSKENQKLQQQLIEMAKEGKAGIWSTPQDFEKPEIFEKDA